MTNFFQKLFSLPPERTGFPVNTRIPTEQGIKRIDEIKVGDRVLCKQRVEDKPSYQPVKKIYQLQEKPVWGLSYIRLPTDKIIDSLFDIKMLSMHGHLSTAAVMPTQEVWLKGSGWTPMQELGLNDEIDANSDEFSAVIFSTLPIRQTNFSNISANESIRNIVDADQRGETIDDVDYFHFRLHDKRGDLVARLNDGNDDPSPVELEDGQKVVVSDKVFTQTLYGLELPKGYHHYIWKLWVKSSPT
ncbi:MAG: hypothetical protein CR974_00135 [Gammaproteobacteria bacterium]|nr:MAG: hypothetical protein CR974_00135 [Gammaproteobacteria bacterium]